MARPISKYFTPVIKKIIEAKNNEKIAVDRQFKEALREKLIIRAGVRPGREGLKRMDLGNVSEKTAGFFGKWKYQLALLPVALLLVLVAARTFKMPVSVKSDVIVPTAGLSAQSTENEIPEEEANVNKIRTFPGRLVLPAGHGNEAERGGQQKAGAGVEGTNYAGQADLLFLNDAERGGAMMDGEAGAPESAEKAVARQGQQSISLEIKPMPGTAPVNAGGGSESALKAETGDFLPVPSVVNETTSIQQEHVKKPGTAAGDLPDEMLSEVQKTAVVVQEAANQNVQSAESGQASSQSPIVNEPVPTEAGTAAESLTKVDLKTQNPELLQDSGMNLKLSEANREVEGNESERIKAVRLVEVMSAPAVAAPVVPIYYDPQFADEDKEGFEHDALAGFMDGKEISMISIAKGADNVMTVELYLKDGTIEKKSYLRDIKADKWDEVVYVRRYFYDDSLKYDLSVPYGTVSYPFQYPYLDR